MTNIGELRSVGGDRTPAPMGEVVGKYRIVRDLGIGGMARVSLAALEGPAGFSKRYVVKRILPEFARNPQFARMFANEARVAALLDHPNIESRLHQSPPVPIANADEGVSSKLMVAVALACLVGSLIFWLAVL